MGHSAEKDATCPHCGRHRPNGCLCRIPIPKTYTQEDMAEAWRAGAQEGFGAPSDWRLGQVYALNPYVLPPGVPTPPAEPGADRAGGEQ